MINIFQLCRYEETPVNNVTPLCPSGHRFPKDVFPDFRALSAVWNPGIDYTIQIDERSRSRQWLLAAIHGGSIEPGTDDIAQKIAALTETSLYTFRAIPVPGRDPFSGHVSSIRFNEPSFHRLADRYERVISIHGCPDDGPTQVFLGGLDMLAVKHLETAFVQADWNVVVTPPGHIYAGRNRRNVCNQGREGAGVQIEFTETVRRDGALSTAAAGIVYHGLRGGFKLARHP